MRLSAIHFRVASFYLHKSDEEKCSTRPWRSPDSLAMNAFFGRDLGACEPRIVCLRLSSATRLCCVIHFFSGINTISKYRKRIPSRVCVVLCLSSTALSLSLSLLYSSQGRARCSQPCSHYIKLFPLFLYLLLSPSPRFGTTSLLFLRDDKNAPGKSVVVRMERGVCVRACGKREREREREIPDGNYDTRAVVGGK